jgi:hypothetical protein
MGHVEMQGAKSRAASSGPRNGPRKFAEHGLDCSSKLEPGRRPQKFHEEISYIDVDLDDEGTC